MESLKARGCCNQKQLEISGDNNEPVDLYFSTCGKLDSYDWLREVSGNEIPKVVEIRFKNTRKGFFANVNELRIKRGDIVAVEASPGHDIGIVTLAGEIVDKQRAKTRQIPAGRAEEGIPESQGGRYRDLEGCHFQGERYHASQPADFQ